jgi:ankyrin repeat protein
MKHEADILSAIKERRLVTLDALYKDTFDSILSQGGEARDLAIRIFSTLLFVKEPLSSDAFCYAISRRSLNRDAAVTMGEAMLVCFNLIVQTSQSVRFVHQSVREYICTLQLFQEPLATSLLAEACLQTCIQGPPEAKPSADETHGFYRYAAMYWGDHASRAIQITKEDAVSHLMLGFVFEEEGSGEIAFSFMAWLDYVKELIKSIPWEHPKYLDLDTVCSLNDTPLFTACIFGLTQPLQHLGMHVVDFDWNLRNDRGHTGLYLACRKGFSEIIKFLLGRGAAVDVSCGTLGNALNAACFSRKREAVELLLLHEHKLFETRIYLDALAVAYNKCDLDIAMLLLDHCIACFKDDDLSQALLGASQAGLVAVVERLRQLPLYLTSNVRTEQRYNKAIRGGHIKMIRYTMQKLSHLAKDLPYDGVATAALHGQAEAVALLLDLGLDVESEGSLGSPLRTACLIERRDIVELLIRRGAEIDKESSMGTALQTAAMRGSNAIIALLLDEGADVDLEGRPYGTALGAAVHNGHKSAAELLLAAGASLDRMPQTSLEGAFRGAHEDMLAFLRKTGFQFHDPPSACMRGPYSILETATIKSNRKTIRNYKSPMGVKHAIPDKHRSDIHRFTEVLDVEHVVQEPIQRIKRPPLINRVGSVQRITKSKGNIHFRSQHYRSGPPAELFGKALVEAATQGHVNAVRTLLQKEKFSFDVLGEAFDEAISNDYLELAEVISAHGEKSEHTTEWRAVLFTSGNVSFVKQVLSHDSGHPARNKGDVSPAYKQSFSCPTFLEEDQATALYRACELGSLSVVQLLFNEDYFSQDTDVLDKALEMVVEYGENQIMTLLLSRKQGEIAGETVVRLLTCAAYGGHYDIMVRIMALTGGLPDSGNVLARPLIAGVAMGHAEAVSFLIQQGADINLWVEDCFDNHWNGQDTFRPFEPNLRQRTRGTSGKSPLWACLDQLDCKYVGEKAPKYETILSILLESGAELSSSVMCTAARKCSASVMQILIRAGGDVNGLMWPTDTDLKELGMENERPLDIAMGRHEDGAPVVEVLLLEKAFMETGKTGGVHPCLNAALSSSAGSRRGMGKSFFIFH